MMLMVMALASAPLATETMTVEPFAMVRNAGSTDIELRVDPDFDGPYRLEITGDQEGIDRLEIRVFNNTLSVTQKQERWGSWRGSPTLRATVRNLEAVTLKGSGDFDARGFVGGPLSLEGSGSGDLSIAGNVHDLEITLNGSGSMQVRGVDAKDVKVRLRGSGDVELKGRADRIAVSVAGSGEVDASGLEVSDATAEVMGSADVRLCATGRVVKNAMGSGDIEVDCD